MSHASFSFAYKKATQALNFFARQAGGGLDKLKALKLVFFADRYHVRKYGRLITNDEYWAMDYGPVASGVKDLAEMSRFLGEQERAYAQKFLRPASDENLFESKTEVEEAVLSATDLEALRFAWERFGGCDAITLYKLTHRYPEWKRHEVALESGDVSRVPITYEDFLENAEMGLEPCFSLTPEEQADRREALQELAVFESKWN